MQCIGRLNDEIAFISEHVLKVSITSTHT